MKISKKLLAFLLSAVMVLSLVVSVSVVASAEATGTELFSLDVTNDSTVASVGPKISSNFYDSTTKAFKNEDKLAFELVTDEAYGKVLKGTTKLPFTTGTGSSTFVDKNGNATLGDTSNLREIFQGKTFTYKVGNKYEAKFRFYLKTPEVEGTPKTPKVNVFLYIGSSRKITIAEGKLGNNQYPRRNPTLSEGWQEYTVPFTITSMTNKDGTVNYDEYTSGQVRFEIGSMDVGTEFAVDYFTLTEYAPRTGAIFEIADGITVKNGEKVIQSGTADVVEEYYGAGFSDESYTVECGAGKSAVVKVDGKKIKAGTGTFEFTVPGDAKAVSVEKLDVDGEIVLADFFNDGTVSGFTAGSGTLPTWQASEDEGREGGVAYVKNKTDSTSGKKRICNIGSGITYEKGYEYTVSFKAKASKASVTNKTGSVMFSTTSARATVFYNTSTTSPYAAAVYANSVPYPNYTTNWDDHAFKISIYDYIDKSLTDGTSLGDAFGGSFSLEPQGFTTSDWVMFDDLIVTRKPLDKMTVKVSGDGKVEAAMYNVSTASKAVARVANDGDVFYSHNGRKLYYFIEPAEGKVAVVNYKGAQEIITARTYKNYVVDGDATLDVKFIDENATAEIANTEILFRNGAVYVYGLISDFVKGTPEYGVKLWNTADEESVWELKALDKSSTQDNKVPAIAVSGQAFAIKAYGDLISEGNTYAAKAYVGDDEGETVTTADAE